MTIRTGMRKAIVVAAATAGMALGLQGGVPAANAHPGCSMEEEGTASDLSPSTQRAWANFICGGGRATGGTARMVSGAWIGAVPTIMAGATGAELTASQKKAWKNWDMGAHNAGHGAAMVVSSVYVGAPSYVMDKIAAGATPADLSPAELRQVSFLMPADSQYAQAYDVPATPELPELPLDPVKVLMELLGGGL